MDWQTITGVAGLIVLIANAGAAIFRWIRPAVQIRQDVDVLKEHDKKDFESLQRLEKMNRAQCNLQLSMINHMIDGNHIEKMKETREHIQDILSE